MEVSLTRKTKNKDKQGVPCRLRRKERRRLMRVTGAMELKPKERSLVWEALKTLQREMDPVQLADFRAALKDQTLLPPPAPSLPA